MKIKKEHYDFMSTAINGYLEDVGREKFIEKYETGDFQNSHRVKSLQQRFCFDLLFLSGLTSYVVGHVYHYANDDHLFTALKKICPAVERRY